MPERFLKNLKNVAVHTWVYYMQTIVFLMSFQLLLYSEIKFLFLDLQ